jgi:aminoglycoside phosphotransferase family enzyme/predicted kinase
VKAEAWLADRSDRVIETSCARIYLAGDTALKIKRPVSLGFLDFSTLEKRKWALDRELAFNRRTAPDIYRRMVAVTGRDGGFAINGDGPVAEWALEMRRFDADAVLSNQAERVDGDLAERLGRLIARTHIAAPPMSAESEIKGLEYAIASNAGHLRSLANALGAEPVARVIEGADAALAKQAPLLHARRKDGFARQCHGDLHLGNILLENDAPVLFDCIEFNDALSEIDTLYDLAFLVMDLDFLGRGAAANRVLNAYLDEAARGLPPSFWDGLAALPLMLSVRAAVRVHVNANSGNIEAARRYLAAAERHLATPTPRLYAVGGLSGSGKTTFARTLAPKIPGAPGAVILRSDEIRKRLWSARPLERLPAEAYGPGTALPVYEAMIEAARQILAAGRPVVLDAAFLAPGERAQAEATARAATVPFTGLWLDGDPETLRTRLAKRRGDASDADARVLETQLTRDLGALTWRRISAGSDVEQEAGEVVERPGD